MSTSPGDLNIDLTSDVTSPDDTFSIRTQNRNFTTYPLSTKEGELFDEQFNTLINDFDSRMLSELFLQRSSMIGNSVAFAKQQFDEKLFGGVNAGDNEIAFDVLRPGHIRADPSDGSVMNDWTYTHSDGWNDWIGDGSSANNYTMDEDQVVLVLGFTDTAPYVVDTTNNEIVDRLDNPPVTGLNVDQFGRNVDMLPKDLNDSRLEDNRNDQFVQSLPSVVGNELDQVHIRLQSSVPSVVQDNSDYELVSEPRLLGLTFGVGSYMNQEEF